jgi:aromatic-amino-acid transaminase
VVRTNYSNPPTHGGKIVATVLDHAGSARALWRIRTGHMRDRIRDMRKLLVEETPGARSRRGFQLRRCASAACSRIPGLDQGAGGCACAPSSASTPSTRGRICVAALNSEATSIYVAQSIAQVLA